jgi:serine/threonine protein kinase
MAKTLENQDYYKSESNTHPIKWIPIETLKWGKYSVQSDCWSFGILLWEMFSFGTKFNQISSNLLGCTPYPEMNNSEAAEKILGGYRLGKPVGCPEEVYQLMKSCWAEKPKDRPSMKEIESTLQSIINKL